MNRIYFILSLSFFTIQQLYAQTSIAIKYNNQLTTLVDNFYEEGLKLDPIRATFNGDNRYNDLLYIDFTDSFRLAQMQMYNRYLSQLKKINRAELNANNKISYDVLNHELQIKMEGLALRSNRILFHQMNGLHTLLATLGGGTVIQPFKTVKDYDNWLKRASVFPAWADSAIVYFKKGIAEGIVLPKTLVIKIIPQLDAQVVSDVTKSVFYGPINKMPASFSKEDKERLTESYTKLITEQLSPAYNRLSNFMKNEYLPKARLSSGYSALPDGEKMYDYYIRQYTTTNKTADEIFKIGLAEVARIQKEMEKVKKEVGYTGDLKSFFEYMRTDPKFFPYKTPEEIINEYYVIQKAVEPKLKRMFNNTPKTPFEVRQTESFRAASSPPQYASGSLENNRPGIFYIPIVDVKK